MSETMLDLAKNILNKHQHAKVEIKTNPASLRSKGEHKRSEIYLLVKKLSPTGDVYVYMGADRELLTENHLGHVESINTLEDLEDIINTPKKVFNVRPKSQDRYF